MFEFGVTNHTWWCSMVVRQSLNGQWLVRLKKKTPTQLSKLQSIIQQGELLELIPDQVQEDNNVPKAKLLY